MDDDAAAQRKRYLTIYLQDHRAGAEAGVHLAERCRDHANGTDLADELARLVAEIDEDRRTLGTIMGGLDVEPSKVKQLTGVAAERLARLKLNGHAVRTSPLSVVVELEGLIGAVSVKRQLWVSLRNLADPARPDAELERLVGRADDQRTRLLALHDRASRRLFDSGASGHRSPDGGTGVPPSLR